MSGVSVYYIPILYCDLLFLNGNRSPTVFKEHLLKCLFIKHFLVHWYQLLLADQHLSQYTCIFKASHCDLGEHILWH